MKRIPHLIISCLLLSGGICAQVTIGSGGIPSQGALLDLKSEANGLSKQGLGLPRVKLSNLAPTSDVDLAKSIGNTTDSYGMAEHIGLMVYNVNPPIFNPATCKSEGASIGLHVWDGSKWQKIGKGASAGIADPGEGIVGGKLHDRDGNEYHIGTFGAAGTWMTENLRTKKAPRLVAMIESASSSTTSMYYAYPRKDGAYPSPGPHDTWADEQGLLYNWYATMNENTCVTTNQEHTESTAQTEVIQGICPFGWHVPSDREWNELEAVFAASTTQYTNSSTTPFSWEVSYNASLDWRPDVANVSGHGKSMKSTTPLNGTATSGDSKQADAGGFNLLLTGSAAGGSNGLYGSNGRLWSSSSSAIGKAWSRDMNSARAGVRRTNDARAYLFSVRCKKN